MPTVERTPATNYRHRAEYWQREETQARAMATKARENGHIRAAEQCDDSAELAALRVRSEMRQWVFNAIDAAIREIRQLDAIVEHDRGVGEPDGQAEAVVHELEEVREYIARKL